MYVHVTRSARARPLLRTDEVGSAPQTHRAVLRARDQAAAREMLRDSGDAFCVLPQGEYTIAALQPAGGARIELGRAGAGAEVEAEVKAEA